MIRRFRPWSAKDDAVVPCLVRMRVFPRAARQLATRRAMCQHRRDARRMWQSREWLLQKRLPKELGRYASVQIAQGDGRFWLVYDNEDSGTGGFKTWSEAVRWFVRQGR